MFALVKVSQSSALMVAKVGATKTERKVKEKEDMEPPEVSLSIDFPSGI